MLCTVDKYIVRVTFGERCSVRVASIGASQHANVCNIAVVYYTSKLAVLNLKVLKMDKPLRVLYLTASPSVDKASRQQGAIFMGGARSFMELE